MSELDTCVASPRLLDFVEDFGVLQRGGLSSDHAPITLTVASIGVDINDLLARTGLLGDHAVLHGNAHRIRLSKRPVKYSRMDRKVFVNSIQHIDVCDIVGTGIDDLESSITARLYTCAENSLRPNDGAGQENVRLDR